MELSTRCHQPRQGFTLEKGGGGGGLRLLWHRGTLTNLHY